MRWPIWHWKDEMKWLVLVKIGRWICDPVTRRNVFICKETPVNWGGWEQRAIFNNDEWVIMMMIWKRYSITWNEIEYVHSPSTTRKRGLFFNCSCCFFIGSKRFFHILLAYLIIITNVIKLRYFLCFMLFRISQRNNVFVEWDNSQIKVASAV